MKNKKESVLYNKAGILLFAIFALILYAMVVQGSYFMITLTVLNVFFIVTLYKREIRIDAKSYMFGYIFAIMCINAIFISNDKYFAIHSLLKYLLFFTSYLFFSSLDAKYHDKIEKYFFYSILILSLFGLAGYFDLLPLSNMVTEKGNRLQSFLQYANTTALFFSIGSLYSIENFLKKKKKIYLLYAGMFILSLVLTNSRTVFAIYTVVLALYLLRILDNKKRILFIVSVATLVFVLTVFGYRITRFSFLEPTLIERFITYQDALKIISQSPFVGLGVGDWRQEQFIFQSAPYYVSHIHNWYLEIALDGGILPFMLFVGLVAHWAYYQILNKDFGLDFSVLLLIFAHSFFDVNFNFGSLVIFTMFVLSKSNKGKARVIGKKLSFALFIPIIALSVLLVSEYSFYYGNVNRARGNMALAKKNYDFAQKTNPFNFEVLYNQALISESSNQAMEYLQQANLMTLYSVKIKNALADGYTHKKDYENAYKKAYESFQIQKYSSENQERLKNILQIKYDIAILNQAEYLLEKEMLDFEINKINNNINKLYKYIDFGNQY